MHYEAHADACRYRNDELHETRWAVTRVRGRFSAHLGVCWLAGEGSESEALAVFGLDGDVD